MLQPFLKLHKAALVLTDRVVHIESDVELQDDQHELEPGAHLLLGHGNVRGEHNVVSLDLLSRGLVERLDLLTLGNTPWHEPLGLRCIFVHTFCCQVFHRTGGTGSCGTDRNVGMNITISTAGKLYSETSTAARFECN